MSVQTPAAARPGTEQAVRASDVSLVRCLELMLSAGASDLHVTAGAPPTVRIAGSLRPLPGAPVLDSASLKRILYAIITNHASGP